MNTSKPQEFITLKSGESQNFAEIYDKKFEKNFFNLFFLFEIIKILQIFIKG